ncbi:AAA family ATPase [Microbacterium dextranolyticum]|uniref:AAA family ATPase n=1 Tax=Microbacterium dextranolyticum TaxID=36806 RepID=A0A9W6M5R4_9MICO|nr:AAA family ATPase [Microbacterium dextranolyticum]MBM7463226.1 hypothetical protein [Microbacterium dextranolyticum]GLJ95669.1 hypothetical protein GCM10017591_17320 [Microbacterium dextranolyticum]
MTPKKITQPEAESAGQDESREVAFRDVPLAVQTVEGPERPVPLADPNMFRPLDTSLWFSGNWDPPKRVGRGAVLLDGHLNWLDGESGSAKTWLAASWALDFLRDGRRVGWLDEEMGEPGLRERMLNVGATIVDLANFDGLEPMSRDLATYADAFHKWAETLGRGALLVIDSAAPVLAAAGVEENSNGEVTQFLSRVVLPLSRRLGITVLVIDHKSKDANGSKYSRGAGSKRNISDAYFSVRKVTPLTKEQDGRYELVVIKDRGAKYAEDDLFDVTAERRANRGVEWSFVRLDAAERERRKEAKADRTSEDLTGKIIATLCRIYDEGMSASKLRDEIGGADSDIKEALKAAEALGRVAQDGPAAGGHKTWRVTEAERAKQAKGAIDVP